MSPWLQHLTLILLFYSNFICSSTFLLDECFNCSNSLSRLAFAHTIIKLKNSITDQNNEALRKYLKIIFLDDATTLFSFFYSFWLWVTLDHTYRYSKLTILFLSHSHLISCFFCISWWDIWKNFLKNWWINWLWIDELIDKHVWYFWLTGD